MTALTLLTKATSGSRLKRVGEALEAQLSGLEVKTEVLGVAAGGWVQVEFSGEDEGAATSYLTKKIGLCPTSLGNVKKFSTLKGYMRKIEKDSEELFVDVGVFQPQIVHATVPLRRLQAELVGGRKVALRKVADLFGFCEGLPVNVKVTVVNEAENRLDAELSSKQVRRYEVWRESLLDRLLVLGPALHEVEKTIERARLSRDVIDVESMGVFEHALTCKLGTDAAGLIPKIGRNLKTARFAVFNPKALRRFLSG
jgi:hypothetical protein